jgi:tryptophan-rich sensory protein
MANFKFVRLIGFVLITLTVGGISSYFTAGQVNTWFTTVNKPSFNPPNWVFGPVWSVLYIMMGVSVFLVWQQPASKQRTLALPIFGIQLMLNFWWSIIFFKFHAMGWALVEIIALWCSILLTIISFSKLSKLAAWLLVPYIAWVSFATLLNSAFWYLNK